MSSTRVWGTLQPGDGRPLPLFHAAHNIGRAELKVTSKYVSRVHFALSHTEDSGALIEAVSGNGTYHNGTKLIAGEPAPLADGDLITLVKATEADAVALGQTGAMVCRFHVVQASEPAPSDVVPETDTSTQPPQPQPSPTQPRTGPPGPPPDANLQWARRADDGEVGEAALLRQLAKEAAELERAKGAYVQAFMEEHQRPPTHDEIRRWPEYRRRSLHRLHRLQAPFTTSATTSSAATAHCPAPGTGAPSGASTVPPHSSRARPPRAQPRRRPRTRARRTKTSPRSATWWRR